MAEPPSAEDRILAAIRAVPRGSVAGYGQIAQRAGLPGRARLVARVLAHNGDAALPWHRVLRSDGRIAFAEGTRGWREQSQRLRAEGVRVERGRVRMPKPEETLDALLWGDMTMPPARAGRGAAGKTAAASGTQRARGGVERDAGSERKGARNEGQRGKAGNAGDARGRVAAGRMRKRAAKTTR